MDFFLVCLFVVCCATAPVTMFVVAIIMSELFSSLCLANIFIPWKIPSLTVLAGTHNQQEALKFVSQKI